MEALRNNDTYILGYANYSVSIINYESIWTFQGCLFAVMM